MSATTVPISYQLLTDVIDIMVEIVEYFDTDEELPWEVINRLDHFREELVEVTNEEDCS